MAWTTPKTFTDGSVLTAAELNTHLRDNLLETAAATATTAGDLVYANGANSMGSRLGIGAANSHLVSTGSAPVWRGMATAVDTASNTSLLTSYETLDEVTAWNFTGEVEVTVTTGTEALVLFKARLSNSAAGSITYMSYSVSGATTVAAADGHSIWYESSGANDQANFGGHDLRTGLTAGSNVFTLEGRVSADTGTIHRPEITVIGY